jgi:hypothetical protein
VVDNYDNKTQEWGEATRLLAMLRAKELWYVIQQFILLR